MKYLSVDDLERLHMQIIDASGGSQGARDRGREEAVVATQTQHVFGEEAYRTVFEKAAALARGIIADHPFVDGNKRTGVMSALLLLELNNVDMIAVEDKKLEDFAVRIATEHLGVEDIAAWLRANSQIS